MTTIELQFRGYQAVRLQFPLTESKFEYVENVAEANAIVEQALQYGDPDRYGWVQWEANGEEFQVREVTQYHVSTNSQNHSGQWIIYADDQGTIVGRYDDPDSVRGHLCDIGASTVTIDADGNGSIVEIPVSWIGDGEPLVGSDRVLALI